MNYYVFVLIKRLCHAERKRPQEWELVIPNL